MKLIDTLRNLKDGLPIIGEDVVITRDVDDFELATVPTDTEGTFEFEFAGNPGPLTYEAEIGSTTKRHSTSSLIPMGELDTSGIVPLNHAWNNGVARRYQAGLRVLENGTNLILNVGAGIYLSEGLIYHQPSGVNVTLDTAHATNPRIDAVVVRATLSGAERGKFELAVKVGTPATSPVAPSLTRNSSTREELLAHVRVDAAVTAIAVGKVTDRRTWVTPADVPPREQLVATDAAVTSSRTYGGTDGVTSLMNTLNFNGYSLTSGTSYRLKGTVTAKVTPAPSQTASIRIRFRDQDGDNLVSGATGPAKNAAFGGAGAGHMVTFTASPSITGVIVQTLVATSNNTDVVWTDIDIRADLFEILP